MAKTIASLENVFKSPTVRQYKKGHVIFHQHDELTQVGYVLDGYVKLYTISGNGEEKLLVLIGPSMPIPFSLSFKKATHVRYFYEAFTDCKLYVTPREQVEEKLNTDKSAKLALAKKMEKLMADLTERLEVFASKSAADKVARLLPHLVRTCGERITKNVYAIKFKITHQDIANMTGLVRETASINLKELEKSGVLTQKSTFTVIDLSKISVE